MRLGYLSIYVLETYAIDRSLSTLKPKICIEAAPEKVDDCIRRSREVAIIAL
jgi:hypothetical protein